VGAYNHFGIFLGIVFGFKEKLALWYFKPKIRVYKFQSEKNFKIFFKKKLTLLVINRQANKEK